MNEQSGSFFALSAPMRELTRITAVSLVLLIGIGFAAGLLRPGSMDPLMVRFTDAAAEIGLYQIEGFDLMITILANNLFSLLLAIAVGLVPYLHLSALMLGLNALLIGALGAWYQTSGRGLFAYLAGTLPHGITEGAALVCSCAAGLYVCRATTWAAGGKVEWRTVSRTLRECLRVYTRFVVPLSIASAALEAFVTPLIFSRFL